MLPGTGEKAYFIAPHACFCPDGEGCLVCSPPCLPLLVGEDAIDDEAAATTSKTSVAMRAENTATAIPPRKQIKLFH